MERKVIEASVYSYGIAGRDRSVKFHQHKLGQFAPDAVDREALTAEAKAWLKTLRQQSRAKLSLLPMTLGADNDFTTMTFTLCSGENIPL